MTCPTVRADHVIILLKKCLGSVDIRQLAVGKDEDALQKKILRGGGWLIHEYIPSASMIWIR
jgi:hypothetical protein